MDGVECNECPVSLITQDSIDTVQQFMRAKRVHEGSGGVLYGPDSSRWPARWFDAVELLERECKREEAACMKAIRSQHG